MFDEREYRNTDFSETEILEDVLEGMTFIRCRFDEANFARIRINQCQFESCTKRDSRQVYYR